MNYTDLAYRTTAAQSASGLSLLIALYDALARDLGRAAAAQRAGDLEARGREIKHALTVIAALENWVEPESGDLARKLVSFYRTLRRKLIDAQVKQSPQIFEEQMAATLTIREIWQRLELRGVTSAGPEMEILPPAQSSSYTGAWAAHLERRQLSWSA
jgi:flagellar protein FliS